MGPINPCTRPPRWLTLVAVLAVATAGFAATGCSSTKATRKTGDKLRYERSLVLAVQAIQVNDLDDAEAEARKAVAYAVTDAHGDKAVDLLELIAGARALSGGDVAEARRQFRRIDDPALAGEVRRRAIAIGLDLDAPVVADGSARGASGLARFYGE